jgi:hypothetical protein
MHDQRAAALPGQSAITLALRQGEEASTKSGFSSSSAA